MAGIWRRPSRASPASWGYSCSSRQWRKYNLWPWPQDTLGRCVPIFPLRINLVNIFLVSLVWPLQETLRGFTTEKVTIYRHIYIYIKYAIYTYNFLVEHVCMVSLKIDEYKGKEKKILRPRLQALSCLNPDPLCCLCISISLYV